ncbi:MAG TPA: Crp/Fnr family transcriptional regulator [Burkholderiales bacterium]|nr:Crp/Fnr family transcriptional regulator [Burkholderiales bacterium]
MRRPAHAPGGAHSGTDPGAAPSAGNGILSRLASADLRMLEPLEYVRLPRGFAPLEAGTAVEYLYFPVGALVSLGQINRHGAMPEIAHIGAEGIVGVTALLGAAASRYRAIVRVPGDAYRLPLSSARAAFAQSTTFRALVLGFTEALMLQISQNVICKLAHTIEQQFCQRLLRYTDHMCGAELEMTHEQMAEALGSRRQGITEVARKLLTQRAIAYSRGRLSVLDRDTLERNACDCYAVVRTAYDELK